METFYAALWAWLKCIGFMGALALLLAVIVAIRLWFLDRWGW